MTSTVLQKRRGISRAKMASKYFPHTPKNLTKVPMVYTTKLDDMTFFSENNYLFNDDKLLQDIEVASKPAFILKSISRKRKHVACQKYNTLAEKLHNYFTNRKCKRKRVGESVNPKKSQEDLSGQKKNVKERNDIKKVIEIADSDDDVIFVKTHSNSPTLKDIFFKEPYIVINKLKYSVAFTYNSSRKPNFMFGFKTLKRNSLNQMFGSEPKLIVDECCWFKLDHMIKKVDCVDLPVYHHCHENFCLCCCSNLHEPIQDDSERIINKTTSINVYSPLSIANNRYLKKLLPRRKPSKILTQSQESKITKLPLMPSSMALPTISSKSTPESSTVLSKIHFNNDERIHEYYTIGENGNIIDYIISKYKNVLLLDVNDESKNLDKKICCSRKRFEELSKYKLDVYSQTAFNYILHSYKHPPEECQSCAEYRTKKPGINLNLQDVNLNKDPTHSILSRAIVTECKNKSNASLIYKLFSNDHPNSRTSCKTRISKHKVESKKTTETTNVTQSTTNNNGTSEKDIHTSLLSVTDETKETSENQSFIHEKFVGLALSLDSKKNVGVTFQKPISSLSISEIKLLYNLVSKAQETINENYRPQETTLTNENQKKIDNNKKKIENFDIKERFYNDATIIETLKCFNANDSPLEMQETYQTKSSTGSKGRNTEELKKNTFWKHLLERKTNLLDDIIVNNSNVRNNSGLNVDSSNLQISKSINRQISLNKGKPPDIINHAYNKLSNGNQHKLEYYLNKYNETVSNIMGERLVQQRLGNHIEPASASVTNINPCIKKKMLKNNTTNSADTIEASSSHLISDLNNEPQEINKVTPDVLKSSSRNKSLEPCLNKFTDTFDTIVIERSEALSPLLTEKSAQIPDDTDIDENVKVRADEEPENTEPSDDSSLITDLALKIEIDEEFPGNAFLSEPSPVLSISNNAVDPEIPGLIEPYQNLNLDNVPSYDRHLSSYSFQSESLPVMPDNSASASNNSSLNADLPDMPDQSVRERNNSFFNVSLPFGTKLQPAEDLLKILNASQTDISHIPNSHGSFFIQTPIHHNPYPFMYGPYLVRPVIMAHHKNPLNPGLSTSNSEESAISSHIPTLASNTPVSDNNETSKEFSSDMESD